MRRIIAAFLLVSFVFTHTEAHELFRIPSFLTHYKEHRAENPTLSFLEFINIHYSKGVVKDSDYDKDTKLPYKSLADAAISSYTFLPHFGECFSFETPEQPSTKISLVYAEGIPALMTKDIWQPPKVS